MYTSIYLYVSLYICLLVCVAVYVSVSMPDYPYICMFTCYIRRQRDPQESRQTEIERTIATHTGTRTSRGRECAIQTSTWRGINTEARLMRQYNLFCAWLIKLGLHKCTIWHRMERRMVRDRWANQEIESGDQRKSNFICILRSVEKAPNSRLGKLVYIHVPFGTGWSEEWPKIDKPIRESNQVIRDHHRKVSYSVDWVVFGDKMSSLWLR